MSVKQLEQCLVACWPLSGLVALLRFFGIFIEFPPGLTRETPRSTANMADGFRPSSAGLES